MNYVLLCTLLFEDIKSLVALEEMEAIESIKEYLTRNKFELL